MNDVFAAAFGESMDEDGDDAVERKLVKFLESGGLYTRCQFPEASSIGSRGRSLYIVLPTELRIELPCSCGPRRTFEYRGEKGTRRLEEGENVTIDFGCTHCKTTHAAILLHLGRAKGENVLSVYKAGQWPSDRPQPSPELAKALGDAVEIYARGLQLERFSYGIGSFAYYRQVAELVIDRLMAALRRYADDHGNEEFVRAIDAVAGEQQASKRIDAVREILPKALRPEGHGNPLGTIYAALSEGLHDGTEEECLEVAVSLRAALEFLLLTLNSHVARTEDYAGALENIKVKAQAKAARAAAQAAAESDPRKI